MRSAVEWLNYHHLYYFWTVAREGSVSKACAKLLLAQPTISGQLARLERSVGEKLFAREGRALRLTAAGATVFRYADEIFQLGRELQDTLRDRPSGRPLRFQVGVANSLPKLAVYRLLQPALEMTEKVHLICHDDRPERLLAALSLHEVDMVLSDAPIPPQAAVKAFNHQLGECGVSFLASPPLAKRFRRGFPRSLAQAPLLLPSSDATLGRALRQYFDAHDLRPDVVAEFADSALWKAFGQAGVGVFPVPTVIETEVRRQYRVGLVGRAPEVRERFYCISAERRLKHPAVLAILTHARTRLFPPATHSKDNTSADVKPA